MMVQHLLHKSQFDAVLGTRSVLSKTVRSEHFFAHRLQITEQHAALFPAAITTEAFVGVMSAKRFAKRAVTRNLIKRQIYAITTEHPLAPAAYAVRLKAPFAKDQFKSASSDALKRVVRAELLALLAPFMTVAVRPKLALGQSE
jgi:ribonuclease P protein component